MKTAATSICLLLCFLSFPGVCFAAQPPQAPRESGALLSQRSEKGDFTLQLIVGNNRLGLGTNTLDIALRDRFGKEVQGALIKVTPWMPVMGHGVWEKPVLREVGGGNYQVDNVSIIMAGIWELKVEVKKGELQDRSVFSFTVAEAGETQQAPETPREGYQRSFVEYQVPSVPLVNQDGKTLDLKTLVDAGKPVVMDFIFTTCTTVCPILSASFASLRRELGENAREVQLISITIDPENDQPEQLKRYRERFNGGPGWEFLTGSRDDVGRVLRAFDAFVVDKMSHEPVYLLRAPNSTRWVRIKGLIKKSDLVREYRSLENR